MRKMLNTLNIVLFEVVVFYVTYRVADRFLLPILRKRAVDVDGVSAKTGRDHFADIIREFNFIDKDIIRHDSSPLDGEVDPPRA